jgi:C_GCAxxG_C_C family probable redox protein
MRESAENLYLTSDFHCAEVVLKVILENFRTELPEGIWSMASGFPRGVGGSGCICGALAGGTMAMGIFFGTEPTEDKEIRKAMQLSRELHDKFKADHKATCCRALTRNLKLGTPERKQQCARISAEVTEETAKIIIREKGADVLKR